MIISVILLLSISVLVMAEEFEELPKLLQKASYTLVHNHRSRTAFVCAVILLMSLASSIGLIPNRDEGKLVNRGTKEQDMKMFFVSLQ